MVRALRAELVLDCGAALGEGPVWDSAARALWWVDIEGRRIHRFEVEGGAARTLATASPVGAVALRAGGGLIAALANGVWTLDPAGEVWALFAPFQRDPGLRCNDGKCDPAGRFLIGTMAFDGRPVGGLFAVEPDGGVRRLLSGLSISNGLAWSRNGATMFFIDT